MVDVAPQRSVFREPAAYAGILCVGYVLAGIAWMVAQESRGRMDPEVDAGVMSLFVLATSVVVFPCGFIVASAGSFLLSKLDWNRPWRPFVAGIVAASILYSGIGEQLYSWCDSWKPSLPLPAPVVGLLLVLAPFQAAVFAACVVGWLIPPWNRARLPQGGPDGGILPPGASQIA
jgi:hypothetical protein